MDYIDDVKEHVNSVKITESRLCFFLSFSYFYFYFRFIFHFFIFKTLGLGLEVISHISHIRWCGHNTDHGT